MGLPVGGFVGSVTASGVGDAFQLGGGPAGIELVSDVVGIGAATSVTVSLDVQVGGQWVTALNLPSLNAVGAVSAVVSSAALTAAGSDGATGVGRLRWAVSGAGGVNMALEAARV